MKKGMASGTHKEKFLNMMQLYSEYFYERNIAI
jgi:hypothetical protein